MDLDLRYETAFAASPDILAIWEKSTRLYGHAYALAANEYWEESRSLWVERYKFSHHYYAYHYWFDTRHGP